MPASLATMLTIAAVLLLLWRDGTRGEARSAALWLPVLWLAITGSRFISQWLELDSIADVNVVEGSPIDAAYFGSLILAGSLVLMKRGIDIGGLVRANAWLAALMLYGLVSVAWADDPTLAGKRWIKTLGHPVMALIILTEADPKAAFVTVMKRCAYVLLPVSVLFIKYLPQLGRGFDEWSGLPVNTGIGLTKNDLGYICMLTGVVMVSSLLTLRRIEQASFRRAEAVLGLSMLCLALWLLKMSDSMTSLVTMALGIAAMLLARTVWISRHLGAVVFFGLLAVWGLEATFGVYESFLTMLGRDPSLTDRTIIWSEVLALQQRPLLGYGFESFWLNERLQILWERWWWRPTQAHNSYIETYLHLGLVGVVLLAGVLLSTFRRIAAQLQTDADFARLRLALFVAIVVFNWTEAGFRGVSFVWTIFYVIALEPGPRRQPQAEHRESFA